MLYILTIPLNELTLTTTTQAASSMRYNHLKYNENYIFEIKGFTYPYPPSMIQEIKKTLSITELWYIVD